MTVLIWNDAGTKKFESGLDHGVLFLPDGVGVSWNGLISVAEKTAATVEPHYFDGKKYNDMVIPGDFSATLSAFTYPDEFSFYEGTVDVGNGIFFHNQRMNRFHLSYRTKIGNDIVGTEAGYKLHILYNLLASPAAPTFTTLNDSPQAITFQWNITSVPVDIADYEPISHISIDTTKTPLDIVEEIEDLLYGTSSTSPELPPASYFVGLAVGFEP